MQILSSIFSFVDFNDPPQSCNEEVMLLPAVNDFGIKFQFIVKDAPDGAEFWVVPCSGAVAISDAKVQATVLCGTLTRLIMHAAVPAIDLFTYLDLYNCFQYAIYDGDPDVEGSLLLALSNPFQVVPSSCYLSKMEYWCNENYADFNYTDSTKTNTVWLYMHLRNPSNPTKETRYVESSGRRRLLSSIMDEEYELKTDAFTQWLHRKIECALLHDYIKITNSNVGFVDEVLSKNATYSKDWQDDAPGVNIAPAKCRMIKNLSYTNNNCGESDCSCTEPPTAADISMDVYKNDNLTLRAPGLLPLQEGEGTLTILPATITTAHGTVVLSADGSMIYTPDEDYTGADSFDYSVQNECGTDIGTITLNIKEMEAGIIVMWSGSPGSVPSGWLLCDGTGGTPNLKGKFIVGYDSADADYDAIGDTGGAKEVTLAITEQGKLKAKGKIDDFTGGSATGVQVLNLGGIDVPLDGGSDQASYGTEIQAPLTAATDGHENRPPFYTLAYIIKT